MLSLFSFELVRLPLLVRFAAFWSAAESFAIAAAFISCDIGKQAIA
jgi:hypothetical protein